MSGRVFLFAGGGTGGHLFPGLAIAEQLERLSGGAGVRSVFLCSDRPLDAKILSREGVEFEVTPAKPVGVRPRALVRFLRSWGPSVRAARGVIARERARGAAVEVVAMGGFVAAPVVQAARVERAPVLLVNMDAAPGKANRWIARHAGRIVTSSPIAPGKPGAGWERVPPIVREAARARGTAAECRAEFGLDPHRRTLLVTGASQGARSINRLLIRIAQDQPKALAGWQVIHQTGPSDTEDAAAAYEGAGVAAVVRPFFERMGEAWGAADLAVSRAGAGSVAEAWANGVPTLFLPYPYHRDEHQKLNAEPLTACGGAVLAKDHVEEAPNLADAGKTLVGLLAEESRRGAMRAALGRLGPADGAERIARMLLAPGGRSGRG